MSKGSIFWGIVLIIIGSLFILINLGVLTINLWQIIGPMLLMLIGLWVILGANEAKKKTKDVSLPLGNIKIGSLQVDFAIGKMLVVVSSDSNSLFEGELSEGFEVIESRLDDRASVTLRVQPQVFPWFWIPGGLEWDVRLNRNVIWNLTFNTGATESTINLTGLKVEAFNLSTGASSTNLILPAKTGTGRYTVKAGLASVNINVPGGVSARIKASAGLGAVTVDQRRFPRINGFYQSNDYETATSKVDLVVETGLGSIDIT